MLLIGSRPVERGFLFYVFVNPVELLALDFELEFFSDCIVADVAWLASDSELVRELVLVA